MATLATIRAEVQAALGNRNNISTRIDRWINHAYFELLMSPRFAFFELDAEATANTGAGVREFGVPADLWFLLDVRDNTHSRKLRRGHWSEFDKRQYTTGIPSRYARFADTIELDPTPDDVYSIKLRYRKIAAELSDTQATVIGREWDEPIETLAIIKGFERLELPEEAAKFRTLLESQLQQRSDAIELEDADAETTIGVRRE